MSSIIAENEFGQIKQVSLNHNMSALEINHKTCRATVSLYGGQVLAWQPVNKSPVFWLSDNAVFKQGVAIRGGIPLCWPWFGSYQAANGDAAGNHGFARQKHWQLDGVIVTKESVTVTLLLLGENEHPLWPFKYQLKQRLVFSQGFEQTLFITNLSASLFEFSAALHSYFSVSSPEHVQILPLADVEFDDKLSGKSQQRQPLENCLGAIDRIYHSNQDCFLTDKNRQRTLKISSTHCQQWVLWNPGLEIAQSMKDLHQGAEDEFVCLEAANTEAVIVQPNETVTIGQKITLM
jgi:glucose-6-phosphate 1-epimerase